jgi:hypothetical protein
MAKPTSRRQVARRVFSSINQSSTLTCYFGILSSSMGLLCRQQWLIRSSRLHPQTLSAQPESEPSDRALKYDTASTTIILLFTKIVVNGSTSSPSLVYPTIQGLSNGTGGVKTKSMICLRKAPAYRLNR